MTRARKIRAVGEMAPEAAKGALDAAPAVATLPAEKSAPEGAARLRVGLPKEGVWVWGTVVRVQFPNPNVIAVKIDGADVAMVRIHEDWRPLFSVGMAIGVRIDGRHYLTRRPTRARFW